MSKRKGSILWSEPLMPMTRPKTRGPSMSRVNELRHSRRNKAADVVRTFALACIGSFRTVGRAFGASLVGEHGRMIFVPRIQDASCASPLGRLAVVLAVGFQVGRPPPLEAEGIDI
eukprot:scaffold431_cov334-Pavlova_lutheri.AAC.49